MSEQVQTVVILGAGRQGRNALEALDTRYQVAGFLDDTRLPGERVGGVSVLGGFDRAFELAHRAGNGGVCFFVALGDNSERIRLTQHLTSTGASLARAIHPTASVSPSASVAEGAYIGAFCRLQPGAVIGEAGLIEAHSLIGCDAVLGPGARTGPHGMLLGGAGLGAQSLLGAGAVVHENIKVATHCVVGANAVVLCDVAPGQRVFGAPARAHGLARGDRQAD